MSLFLLFSLPLFFLLVLMLPWRAKESPGTPALFGMFLKGLLLFFPGLLVILIARRIFGFSYMGVGLFVSLLLRDQLVPLLAAVGAFLLMKKKLDLLVLEEGIFLGVFAFLCGFLSMVNLADMIRAWGQWDGYILFLLPLQRLAAVLFVSLLARRFYPWEGREAVLLCVFAGSAALVLTVAGFLFVDSRAGWAVILTAAPVAAVIVAFAMRFPRALRA